MYFFLNAQPLTKMLMFLWHGFIFFTSTISPALLSYLRQYQTKLLRIKYPVIVYTPVSYNIFKLFLLTINHILQLAYMSLKSFKSLTTPIPNPCQPTEENRSFALQNFPVWTFLISSSCYHLICPSVPTIVLIN